MATALSSSRNSLTKSSKLIIETRKIACNEDLNKLIETLKQEFLEKYNQNKLAESSDKLSDFKFMTILGQGAFGIVKLVKHNETENFYAMKIICKKRVIKSKQLVHCLSEKKVLQSLRYPFTVHLDFAFKDNSYLYFCMPFINGGEMFTHLRKQRKFEEKLSKFYAAQVFMGLEYIHKLGLIYRDLKPENLMIDFKGYVKITDFGFCKPLKDRTYTLCGTPEYLAPEVIQSKGYGHSADWWSYGILIFELSSGFSPFSIGNPDQMQLLERICIGKYKMPSHLSKDLKNLIENILQIDLSRRYGGLKNGPEDVKKHPWFNDTDWIQLYNQDVVPTFVPKVSGPGDYSQFDDYDDIKLDISSNCLYEKEFADF